MTATRALLIGASYRSHPELALRGCANDVCGMAHALQGCDMAVLADGVPQEGWERLPASVRAAVRGPPSRAAILAEVDRLVAWAEAEPGASYVWFYFSGHGGQVQDSGKEELDGKDEYILAGDVQGITDDVLRQRLVEALPARCTLMAIIDACHSGTMLDLKNRYRSGSPSPFRLRFLHPRIRASAYLLSSSRHNQTSVEVRERNRWGGALTLALLPLLRQRQAVPLPSCEVLLGGLTEQMRRRQQPQRPQLRSTARLEGDTVVPLWPA
jgi:hypothetical protein